MDVARLRETCEPQVPVSLMGRYFPAYHAASYPGPDRRLAPDEYERAVETASRLGPDNVFPQGI